VDAERRELDAQRLAHCLEGVLGHAGEVKS
jgi:hypothetical protein